MQTGSRGRCLKNGGLEPPYKLCVWINAPIIYPLPLPPPPSPLLKSLESHTYIFLKFWISNWGGYCNVLKRVINFAKIGVYSPHEALESIKSKKGNMSSSVKNDIDIWPPILVFTNKHNIVPSIQLCSFYILIYYWRVEIRKINWISCFPWCESIFKDEWMKQGMGRDLTGMSRAQPQKFLKYDVLRSSKMSISACVFLF